MSFPFALLVSGLVWASSLTAQTNFGASDVHLRIETERSTYRAGDSIRVRLTLLNLSGSDIQYWSEAPKHLARLRVLNGGGSPVDTISTGSQGYVGNSRKVTMKSGAESTLRWVDGEWINLRDWGYELRTPDQYVIVGVPGIAGPNLQQDLDTPRSNEVTITIEP
jgi:hypothetical protein